LLPVAERVAHKIGGYNPTSVRFAKQTITRGRDLSLEAGLELEARLGALLMSPG